MIEDFTVLCGVLLKMQLFLRDCFRKNILVFTHKGKEKVVMKLFS